MTMMSSGIIRTEILVVADTVAREKGIDREEVLEAMEIALQKASRVRYGMERDIRVSIHRKTGEIFVYACREVVEDVQNSLIEISLEDAQRIDESLQLGDFVKDPLPPIDLGRVAAQTAKQVVFQRIRDAERQRQYDEYKKRVGEIANGQVKRVEFGSVIVDLGQTEAFLARDQLIPRESFRPGDRIRAYIMDVREEQRGPQIFLSRTHPHFMAKLFAQEVPEIYEGVIEIKSVSRDPGSRAKMAVHCAQDKSIDPVGSCVGMRGSRVQAVTTELQGEKIDIIPWSSNPAVFVVNALVPAEVTRVVLDEDSHRVEVVVPDDQLSLAIGRRGQNVRLASLLTEWGIDVISESNESNRRTTLLKNRSLLFEKALDVDDVLSRLLVTEGFTTIEEIAYINLEDLTAIEGFEEELAQELKMRAQTYLEKQEAEWMEKVDALGVDRALLLLGLKPEMVVILGENGVKTLDDFADLSAGELCEFCGGLDLKQANQMIMQARQHWFEEPKQENTEED